MEGKVVLKTFISTTHKPGLTFQRVNAARNEAKTAIKPQYKNLYAQKGRR